MRTDESTAILYDCGVWTDAHSQSIWTRFPECSMSVVQSHASLSGFIIVFKMEVDRAVRYWVLASIIILIIMFFTARQMMFLSKELLS